MITEAFTLTRRELFRFLVQQYFRRTQGINLLLGIGAVMVVMGAVGVQGQIGVPHGLLLLGLWALIFSLPRLAIGISLTRRPADLARHYALDEKFITAHLSDGTSLKKRFDQVKKLVRTRDGYFLIFERGDFLDVPRRAFRTRNDWNKFEAILFNHRLIQTVL